METGANRLVNELTQGSEQESELSTSIELCMSLAQEILADIDKALSMAQSGGCPNLAVAPPDSPPSPRSPRSEITRHTFKAERTEMISKKRKTRRELILKLGSGPEAEGPLDEGYSWRKYGQKGVRGAKHPRCYYKCKSGNYCLARKHVQRSDDNPAIFIVTYTGTHTCNMSLSLPAAAASSFLSTSPPSTLDDSGKLSLPAAAASSFLSSSPPSTVGSAVSPKHSFSPTPQSLNCFTSSLGRESSYGETPSLQTSKFTVLDLDFPPSSPDLLGYGSNIGYGSDTTE